MNKKVLFVSDYPKGREQKIATGLEKLGWDIILCCFNKPSFFNHNAFTHIRYCSTASDIIAAIKDFSPDICHIFTYYNYAHAYNLINHENSFPIIVDPYDIIFEMFADEFLNRNKYLRDNIQYEKICLQQADGICCRHLESQVYKRKYKLALKNRILLFDGCLKNTIRTSDKLINSKSDIQIVYSGSVAIEKLYPELKGAEGFLSIARKIIATDMNFHLYPAHLVSQNFENDFSDYRRLEESSEGKFQLHTPVPYDNLVQEISQYDIALLGPICNIKSGERTDNPYQYGMVNKLFDYIDAGLAIIPDPASKVAAFYTRKLGIDISLEGLSATINEDLMDYIYRAKKNIKSAQKYFDIIKHAVRLSDYYHQRIQEKKSQKFGSRTIFDAGRQNNDKQQNQLSVSFGLTKIGKNRQRNGHQSIEVDIGDIHRSMGLKMDEFPYPAEFNELTPKIFIVEPILGCDLKCPECAIGKKLITKKKGFMRFEQFKIIANKIRPLCRYLYLHHNGEPLLNPDIFQMIEYASKFAGVNISTNGQSLNKNKAEKLILSGVTEIIVSIDGFSQKVYQQYRVGGLAGKALWSLKMLQEFNRLHGERVKIMPQFIVFKHNQHEMDLFAEFCHFLGLNPFFKAPFIREGSQFNHAENPEYRRSSFPDLASLRQQMKSCPDPREVFTILLDGTCVMCCNDNNGTTAYGNIFDQEVLDIWNSTSYKKDRWDIVTGKAPNYCIENCLVWSLRHN